MTLFGQKLFAAIRGTELGNKLAQQAEAEKAEMQRQIKQGFAALKRAHTRALKGSKPMPALKAQGLISVKACA
ncbi:MAG: hypothetical protein HUU03_13175 [Planctomycetaceae bacterium]|nr:hypothetical protein [Planctomycetaceae bacterium]